MSFEIRPYHTTDLAALYRICLLTSSDGDAATAHYDDPNLLGHFFAAPYAVLAPDLCFVLTERHIPIGYVLGVRDSAEFGIQCEQTWFPTLRTQYPLPNPADTSADAAMIRLIHQGHDTKNHFPLYPAHLHIDILPQGQKLGFGRTLLETLFTALRMRSVSGVHLEVSKKNQNAVDFYQHIGFHCLTEYPMATVFGLPLSANLPE